MVTMSQSKVFFPLAINILPPQFKNIYLISTMEIQDWEVGGMVIHWELCKKSKFDHANKWYIHKPEYVLENGAQNIPRDTELKINHLNPARRPDLGLV